MTTVISGTNGLLQSYDYQVLTTGFTYTFAAGTQVLVMNPSVALATGTITMPASPADGMTITFSSSQQITALTMAGNGASINNAVTLLPAKTSVTYVYRATGTTWYPTATVPGTGSQLVQGTSVASTSGTSIDFTGIPSWVKRITVMFNGVSLSGTSNMLVRIGSGSIDSISYVSSVASVASSVVTAADTSGFIISNIATATDAVYGHMIIDTLGSNIWVHSCTLARSSNSFLLLSSGSHTTSSTLDRVRITTANGTDTFDAGSINILYE